MTDPDSDSCDLTFQTREMALNSFTGSRTATNRRKRKQIHTLRAENITSDFYQYIDVDMPCEECECGVRSCMAGSSIGQFCVDFGDSAYGAAKLLNEPLFPIFAGHSGSGGHGMKTPVSKQPAMARGDDIEVRHDEYYSHVQAQDPDVGLDLTLSSRSTPRRPRKRRMQSLQKHYSFPPSPREVVYNAQRTPEQDGSCRSSTASPTESELAEHGAMFGARRKITYGYAATPDHIIGRDSNVRPSITLQSIRYY